VVLEDGVTPLEGVGACLRDKGAAVTDTTGRVMAVDSPVEDGPGILGTFIVVVCKKAIKNATLDLQYLR